MTDKDGGSLASAHARIDASHALDGVGLDGAIADLDGDGRMDLAVGAPRDVDFGFDRPGRVGPIAAGRWPSTTRTW